MATLGHDSGPFRFGSIGQGIEAFEVCLLICFSLLAFGSWISSRRDHPRPGPLHEQANESNSNFVVVKYATKATIRQGLRNAIGSRAKRRKKTYVFGVSTHPEVDDDIEAGACAPSPHTFPPPTIDEVLQNSVRGFREKWWPTRYTDPAYENVRVKETESDFDGIGGCDMHPETKAFLDNHVYSRPSPPSTLRTCPAVERHDCFLRSPSTAGTADPPPSSISRECTAVEEEICLLPSPSTANVTSASFNSAARGITVRARADMTNNGMARYIIGEVVASVVLSMPTVERPTCFDEPLSAVGEEEPELVTSRMESGLPLSQEFALKIASADMEPDILSLPDRVPRGELRILRGLDDPLAAVRGEYLARNCSLSRCEDNGHLAWHEVLGEGAFGRVTLVSHELGKYAVKELTEEAGADEQWAARNEMEAILRLLLDTARGLGHMHAKGKVHRDVKAGNVVVVGGDDESTPLTAKVADFGMTCDIGTRTEAGTGSPGYIPVENLAGSIEAGPDGDVFSFAVLMLFVLVKKELRENNMFAHTLLLTAEERVELDRIYGAGGDSGEVFTFQCQVKDRVMYDGSFDDIMLLPERLDDSVPRKSRVLEMLWRCLSTVRTMRPSMKDVAAMLADLLEED
eukprot:jgi/Undpi1/3770/HiC_scaffold_16.g07139.m1